MLQEENARARMLDPEDSRARWLSQREAARAGLEEPWTTKRGLFQFNPNRRSTIPKEIRFRAAAIPYQQAGNPFLDVIDFRPSKAGASYHPPFIATFPIRGLPQFSFRVVIGEGTWADPTLENHGFKVATGITDAFIGDLEGKLPLNLGWTKNEPSWYSENRGFFFWDEQGNVSIRTEAEDSQRGYSLIAKKETASFNSDTLRSDARGRYVSDDYQRGAASVVNEHFRDCGSSLDDNFGLTAPMTQTRWWFQRFRWDLERQGQPRVEGSLRYVALARYGKNRDLEHEQRVLALHRWIMMLRGLDVVFPLSCSAASLAESEDFQFDLVSIKVVPSYTLDTLPRLV